jgi:predicted PurR-regulated permease PerM
MIFDRMEQDPGARLLFNLACLVVVVYGLRYAASILLPSALALFLAVLSLPVLSWLRRHRIPAWLALTATVALNVGVFGLLIVIASQSMVQFQDRLGVYLAELQALQVAWIAALEVRTGLAVSSYIGDGFVDPQAVVNFARNAVGQAAQFISTTFLVFLIMAFMLSEASIFPAKFRFIMGGKGSPSGRVTKVVREVQTYVGIKTVVSLATGLILGLWCFVLGLDFPVLLGVIAFLFNFIPTVGSIIATLPAILLSLVLVGTVGHALLVAVGYVAVNLVFGNIIEPMLQGRQLGLSTLVVVLSLLFWGWAWGPIGALLSVPLTVVVKIWLENTQDLSWVAILLDKSPPKTPVETPSVAVRGVAGTMGAS